MDQQSVLLALLDAGIYQCQAAVGENGTLLLGLLTMGLVGSMSHCVGMCAPFVLSQVTARLEAQPASRMREWHRLTGAALVPYHLGRAATYVGLAVAASSVAQWLLDGHGLRWLSATLLGVAALFMLALALPALKRLLGGRGDGEGWWSRGIGRAARPLFASPTGWRGFALGVSLGFIPCGLLYGAIAAAASAADPLTAALGMLAFWAGTVPSLFGVGLLGHAAGRQWRGPLLRYAPLLLMVNAGTLGYMAWRAVI